MKTNELLIAAGTRHRNRGTDCDVCKGHEHAAADDVHRGTGSVPSWVPTGQIASQTELASLERANEWLNSPPLTPSALRGKVVLIDFWTYTCINWRRTLPYVRAWAEKYKDQGLVVIGVHAPEFAFEKNTNHVRWAVKDMGIDYPIAVDNDYVIWRAFENQYWPALYFIDAQGRVRHHHFGEGSYEQSEMIIQRLLNEAGVGGIGDDLVSVDARGLEADADWGHLKSPENYVGFERTELCVARRGSVGQASHV
jgi:thiol-disulfide isomerase/thioredoxin